MKGVEWIPVTHAHRDRVTEKVIRHRKALLRYEQELRGLNQVHNLISRSAEAHIFNHHILHCLSIACLDFPRDVHIVDWGSGGGLPAIPLAIVFPSVDITAVDKVGKKIRSVTTMAHRLGLERLSGHSGRAELYSGTASYSVSRATARLMTLWGWHIRVKEAKTANSKSTKTSFLTEQSGSWPEGLLCLKGGDLNQEIGELMSANPHVRISAFSLQR
jgi:16S rRNA (guanine527-N7)-methyltransferase